MEFKGPYLQALSQDDLKLFMELRRSGKLDQHLQQKSEEAHALLKQLLQNNPRPSLAQEREAEEQVRATLIEFPQPPDPENPEPPDDLLFADQYVSDDQFPLSKDDLSLIDHIATLFRSELSTMTPAELRSVAALLLALKRLPGRTTGVDVSISFRQTNSDGNYGWANIYISEYELRLGIGEHFYDPGIGGDTESETLFEACVGADTCQGNIEEWLSYVEARRADGSLSVEQDDSDFDAIDWYGYDEGET